MPMRAPFSRLARPYITNARCSNGEMEMDNRPKKEGPSWECDAANPTAGTAQSQIYSIGKKTHDGEARLPAGLLHAAQRWCGLIRAPRTCAVLVCRYFARRAKKKISSLSCALRSADENGPFFDIEDDWNQHESNQWFIPNGSIERIRLNFPFHNWTNTWLIMKPKNSHHRFDRCVTGYVEWILAMLGLLKFSLWECALTPTVKCIPSMHSSMFELKSLFVRRQNTFEHLVRIFTFLVIQFR